MVKIMVQRGFHYSFYQGKNNAGDLNYRLRRLKEKSATKSVPSGEVELDSSEAQMIGDAGKAIYC